MASKHTKLRYLCHAAHLTAKMCRKLLSLKSLLDHEGISIRTRTISSSVVSQYRVAAPLPDLEVVLQCLPHILSFSAAQVRKNEVYGQLQFLEWHNDVWLSGSVASYAVTLQSARLSCFRVQVQKSDPHNLIHPFEITLSKFQRSLTCSNIQSNSAHLRYHTFSVLVLSIITVTFKVNPVRCRNNDRILLVLSVQL